MKPDLNPPTQQQFLFEVRRQFEAMEAMTDSQSLTLLTEFYEMIGLSPWERGCGYRSAYVDLRFFLDIRDKYLGASMRPVLFDASHREATFTALPAELVLQKLEVAVPKPAPGISLSDCSSYIAGIAAAVSKVTERFFVPEKRPSIGFHGFSWWPELRARLVPESGSR